MPREPKAGPALASAPQCLPFTVVGVGASAGGLEALEALFSALPPDSGLAFVVVQHLSSDYESVMGRILAKDTTMPIQRITEGLSLESDHIYLNPPDREVDLREGRFHLVESQEKRGLRRPIDWFFKALARECGARAAGVILSGSGSDGTEGLGALLKAGALSVVQDEDSAKYASMPRSAEAAGHAEYVLPPAGIADLLLRYGRDPGQVARPVSTQLKSCQPALNCILQAVREASGHDFSRYKRGTLLRRIERRMQAQKMDDPDIYARFVQSHPKEARLLFGEFLIPVTRFFREPEAFELLRSRVLPELLERMGSRGLLRVWVAGCSTGEEAYSLAILIKEAEEACGQMPRVQIFATDVNPEAVEVARQGLYPEKIDADVSPERLTRFFQRTDSGYRVRPELREWVIFSVHDVLVDPPFSRLDLILCRNLFIYLEGDLHPKLFQTFHYALGPGGHLLLGESESIGRASDLFSTVDKLHKLFRRKGMETGRAHSLKEGGLRTGLRPGAAPHAAVPPSIGLLDLAEKLLLVHYAPPSVVVDEDDDVIQYTGRTEEFLQLPSGTPTHNLLKLARPGLAVHLRGALERVRRSGVEAHLTGVQMSDGGGFSLVDLTLIPILHPEPLRGKILVAFEHRLPAAETASSPATAGGEQRTAELEWELDTTRRQLQEVVQELESAYMEQRTGNEELQSINEELQSTNEELQTANEEQQSTYEEMLTVNAELQRKVEDLLELNDDMENLLRSISVATLFLDREFRIRRFTPAIADIIPLLEGDLGRPLTLFTSSLEEAPLLDIARQVLDTLVVREVELRHRDGRWYHLRALPYRAHGKVVDGVILTFFDISDQHRAREILASEAEAARRQQVLLETRVAERTARLSQTVEALNLEVAQRKTMEQRLLRTERILRAVRAIDRLVTREADPLRLLDEACHILTGVAGYRMAWVGFVEEGHKRVVPVARAGAEEGYLDQVTITWDDTPTGQGPTGTALKTRSPSIANDIANDPRFSPWRAEALKHGFRASAAFPLLWNERMYGVLNVYSEVSGTFAAEETGLLAELAEDITHALHAQEQEVQRGQATQTQEQTKKELERQVSEHGAALAELKRALQTETARRKQAERTAQRENEQALRYLEVAQVMLLALDTQGRITLINRKGAEMLGYPAEELKGRDWFETCIPAEDRQSVREVFARLMAGDIEPTLHVVNRVLVHGGGERRVAWRNTLLRDETGRSLGTLSSGTDVTDRQGMEGAE